MKKLVIVLLFFFPFKTWAINSDLISGLASKYTIYYVFSPNCGWCKRFSPILSEFSYEYQFKVRPVIMSSSYIDPESYLSVFDTPLVNDPNLQGTPSTYLFDEKTGEYYPIFYGYATKEDFEGCLISKVKNNDFSYSCR